MFNYAGAGIIDAGLSEAMYSWSMQKYKSEVENQNEDSEILDELEKSIIANIADEVQVGVSNQKVELIVQKKF